VTCANEGAVVALGGLEKPCPATFEVEAGEHRVTMTWSVVQWANVVNARAGRDVWVEFERASAPAPPTTAEATTPISSLPDDVTVAETSSRRAGPDGLGVVLVSVGLGVGTTSVFLDGALSQWPAYAHDGRLSAADFVPAVGYAAALGLVTVGVWRLIRGTAR
jgi:hypothetical protein